LVRGPGAATSSTPTDGNNVCFEKGVIEQNRLDKRHVLLDHTAPSSPSVTLNPVNTPLPSRRGEPFPPSHQVVSISPSIDDHLCIDRHPHQRENPVTEAKNTRLRVSGYYSFELNFSTRYGVSLEWDWPRLAEGR
jgi:hypothetical protein